MSESFLLISIICIFTSCNCTSNKKAANVESKIDATQKASYTTNSKNYRINVINAINQHRLDLLYKTIENVNYFHSKEEVLRFLKTDKVINYYNNLVN